MIDRFKAEFEVLDDRFSLYGGDNYVEVLHRGSRKTEGPAYFPAGRYLVWSDIPNDRLLRWDETTGVVGVFRHSSGNANGNTVDAWTITTTGISVGSTLGSVDGNPVLAGALHLALGETREELFSSTVR